MRRIDIELDVPTLEKRVDKTDLQDKARQARDYVEREARALEDDYKANTTRRSRIVIGVVCVFVVVTALLVFAR